MEPYILTAEDIARLMEQGFDMRGVAPGVEATAREASILRGPVSTADIPTPESLPYDPSSDPSAVMPVSSTTPAPVTFTEADGTRSTVPSPSDIPQALPPAAADAGATMRAPGTAAPLADFGLPFGMQAPVGGGFNPMAGGGVAQSTDPFEGLSRNQRMMLGFAALRDAAASLEGRDTSFFNDQLGVFEGARERERLRVQGLAQSRGQVMASLLPVYQEITRLQGLELPVPQYLLDIVNASLAPFGFGSPSGAPITPTGAPTTTPTTTPATTPATVPATATTPATAPTTTPTTPTTETPATEAPAAEAPAAEQPQTPTEARLAEIPTEREALMQQMRERLGARAATDDIEEQMRLLDAEEERLREQLATETAAAEAEEATAVQEETLMVPLLGDALGFLLRDGEVNTQGAFTASRLSYELMGEDARKASAALDTLRGIQTLNSVQEARAAGYTGTFTDADIAIIQSVAGPLDLRQPEATVATLQRIAERLSPQARQALGLGGGGQTPSGQTPSTFQPTDDQRSILERYQ